MAHVSRHALAREIARQLARDGSDDKAVMRSLAAYLVEHNITEEADVLINDIAAELFSLTGRLAVEVTSAHPLTDAVRGRIREYFTEETGAQTVELHETVDESLIGGFIARTPTAELDTSVRNTLRQLTPLA